MSLRFKPPDRQLFKHWKPIFKGSVLGVFAGARWERWREHPTQAGEMWLLLGLTRIEQAPLATHLLLVKITLSGE